ncbi:MAG: GntR family transcriptional regulator [Clostridiales bacterium]|nr:GntR family transcriptional regulator [Clostridiales bacterium]
MREETMEGGRTLSTDLADKMRIEILGEQLKPGEKLTEQALCASYNVSRTPVREALKNLDAEGLIEIIPNRGAFVVGLSENDIRDLYTLRIQSEMQAVHWAIERRTKEEMASIEENLDFMRFYTERADSTRMRSINAGFHKAIAAAAHNRILESTLSRIQDYIRYSVHIRPYLETDLDAILREHRAIFKAFRSSDPEAGSAAMKKHIENSMKRAKV